MNSGMKYISFEGPYHREIILFPNSRDHAQMAQTLGIKREDIIGAGFASVNDINPPSCHGRSTSLNIVANKDDTELLRWMIGWTDD